MAVEPNRVSDASKNLLIEGSLEVQENIYPENYVLTGKVYHAYGGFQEANTTITIAGATTWYHITNGTNDLWNSAEMDGVSLSGDVFTITNAGDYVGSVSFDISALNGKDYHVRLYNVTQATQVGYYLGVSTSGAGNQIAVSFPLYIEAAANDQFRFEIANQTDTTDVVVDNAVFYFHYLHD